MSSIELGAFRITLVREDIYWWDGGAMFGVVPRTLWSRRSPPDELNRLPLGFNCYIVETGEHTILLDTGGGDKLDARRRERMKLPPTAIPLPEKIAAAGIDPNSIDIVVNSHLHWDHCGWNTILTEGVPLPAFPRAAYYTRRGEWEHAHLRHPRDSVAYIDANYDPLVESGRMHLIDEDAEVAPGIRLCVAPGHTRDMMVITAASGSGTFCFLTDLVPTAAHLMPTWVAAFDLDPIQSIDSKLHWLGEAARGEWICAFAHEPDMAFARIVLREGKFEAVASGPSSP
ncbi:MAG TPA: MBL fold metallo-hydrolase [Bryobacteraceae bacterium]|nr:MBL fold metallo-hydrolase [Bryobacteraceae bacterium]